ncbi:hypothetical protein FSW04_21040 [Baekduia soli]|uniref:Uncharacterized protein n=1 Tax=Baekduia soli TaxID=496014 RepID=A0A5B8U9G3_9ACTN|nr:hypothetical protein FSW04_21040 [Baekduia soli]
MPVRRGFAMAAVAAVAAVAVAVAAPAVPAPAASAPFVATLKAGGHHPRAGHLWPITVTARSRRGTPLSGRIGYEYLFEGQVVARRSNYAFHHGRFHDTIVWPARSAGIHLTFRVVVRTRLGVVRLPYAVVVRR